jgi:hypothetical protein
MSLKGNVEAFSLAAILQSIKTNQHSGTLKIEKDKNKKLIYFTQGEVYLLSEGVKKMRKMGHHLVKNRIVSEKAIQDALIEQRQTNKLLGEILKEQGLITDEDINKILIHQIEEEIYSIFFWNYATFEFTKDFFPPEFINPVKDVKKVSFNTNSLLMEAARRMDDWQRIEKFVPTEKMIFKKNPHFPVEKLKLDSPLENVSSRFQDINGIHEVASLLTLWQLERYEGYEFLMQCSSQGAIEAIPSNELQALFQEAFSARDFKRCFDYYELALVAYRELSESFELKIFTNPEFIQSSNNYSFSCENLSDYPLSKLILTLFDNRVVGTLKISKGLDSKLIFFTGDNLWFVSKGRYSTQNFFDFFFHYWSIPSEIQHQLLEIQDKSRYFIQDTIIQTGVVSRDEFNQILQEKIP